MGHVGNKRAENQAGTCNSLYVERGAIVKVNIQRDATVIVNIQGDATVIVYISKKVPHSDSTFISKRVAWW